ncbi:flagellar hook-length control protein FliK [Limnohabitans sp. B9-3]|uniref:flagellar hook-length control protein FliK n=1 Tax=Limnohabitans sp. B9-3 TaxID=1100707 RepID=UPI000C1F130C|nr:flagellar hook-length control protein FliK [Limnohabitans sp. B9-3]PIT72006.1 hypothetical protein B9Z42_13995 [Limnohabitans sp. B9-3]
MNLSSYLQMPPAPAVPQSLSTSATQGLAAGLRADAGSNAGKDFANIMARQFQRLSVSERPSFAAESTPRPDHSAKISTKSHQDSAQNQARTSRADDALQSDTDSYEAEKSSDEKRAEQRAQQLRDAASAQALNEADATLLAQVAMMAMPSATPSQDAAATASEAALSLRAIALSPQMHIITAPSASPNAESLTAFAQSMGLDEAAIQKLLGEGASSPSALLGTASPVTNAALSATSGVVLSAQGLPLSGGAPGAASANESNALMQVLNAAVAGTPTSSTHNASGLTTALTSATPSSSAATQLAALGLLPDTHAAATGTDLPSHVPVMTAATAVLATNANVPTAASQAPAPLGLSAAEMASIQHVEITLAAPAATVAASSNSAGLPNTFGKSSSTLDALSLLGGDVTEQSISELVAQFSQNAAGGDDAQQQPSSGNSSGQGFAQALAQTNAPAQTANANAPSSVATTTPMSEVYDQLSDKMATEMAARMHKQLSDGEWKMKFGLRPAHLGGVEIQLEMKDGKLNAMFQAENPLTRDLLQNSSQRLRDALENFGIQAGQMHIGQDSGHAQQNPSRGSAKPSQVGDNSPMQVKDSDTVASATESRNKANASLLDLYA